MSSELYNIISLQYRESKRRNPSYSLRAFASKLKVQPSALSEILSGKRSITDKMAARIIEKLNLSESKKKRLLELNSVQIEQLSEDLTLDYFKTISDWHYFAILSLAELQDFRDDAKWISTRLNITKKKADTALAILKKLNMLQVKEDGTVTLTGVHYKTPTDVVSSLLKKHTLQTLDLAKWSLLNDDIDKRDFSTVTMAINPNNIKAAKEMIKSFRKRLAKKLESGKQREVYKVAIQLFPLSRESEKDEA